MSRVAVPITMANQLPVVGTAYENAELDFKRQVDPTNLLELAKDIAAFANQFGGTILVGMEEGKDGLLEAHHPLPTIFAAKVQTAYETAARELLSPRPRVQAARIAINGGECIAVNIEPYLDGVVAARADADNPHVWRFPIRIGKECKWLTPEEVALMTPQTRKAIVMLSRIDLDEKIFFSGSLSVAVPFKGLNLDENVIVVGHTTEKTFAYPLDMVRSVYRAEYGWCVVMDAFR